MNLRQTFGIIFGLLGAAGSVFAFFLRNDAWLGVFVGCALIGLIVLASGFVVEKEV